MMSQVLAGILPVLPTPFTPEGEVDLALMPAIVKFAIKSGVHGVVFPGFASEVEHLTDVERQALLALVVESVAGAIPIVAGASAGTADEAIAHAQAAAELGVNWVMIQPPTSIGTTAQELIPFFKSITKQLPDVRIVLQNAPLPRGSNLSPQSLLDLVKAIPQIAYIKEETLPAGPAISMLVAQSPQHLLGVIGGGGARYILDEYERGACAAMPAIELADLHVELDIAWRSGDKVKARDFYIRTLPLLTLQAVYRMRLTKHTLMRRGIVQNAIVRSPTAELDVFSIADIDNNLHELGLIGDSSQSVGKLV
jgi:dihydrodipicolinate synthase/N-acetylneuraminate lyase